MWMRGVRQNEKMRHNEKARDTFRKNNSNQGILRQNEKARERT